MSYRHLPDSFTMKDAISSLRGDLVAIAEIFARGEGDVAFEDVYLSILNTLRDLEKSPYLAP